jgi:transposase
MVSEVREMCRLFVEDGLSAREIGKRVDRHESVVQRHLLRNGLRRSLEVTQVAGVQRTRSEAQRPAALRRMIAADRQAKALAMYVDGAPLEKIHEESGVSPNALYRAIRRDGTIPFRRPSATKEARAVESAPASPESEDGERLPVAPLAAAISRYVARSDDPVHTERVLALRSGVSERLLLFWREGERETVNEATAERVLDALGLLWWEVYDLALAPVGVNGSWVAACERACELWGEG